MLCVRNKLSRLLHLFVAVLLITNVGNISLTYAESQNIEDNVSALWVGTSKGLLKIADADGEVLLDMPMLINCVL